MGGPCATGSSIAGEISPTGWGDSVSITTGSPTDSKKAALSMTGSAAAVSNTGAGSSKTGVAGSSKAGGAGSKATGVHAGSDVTDAHTGSGAAGSIQLGVSAKTGPSLVAGISSKRSITSAGSSMIFGSPTELNSVSSVTGAETDSKSDFSGSATKLATGSTTGVSTRSTTGAGAGVRGTKFSTTGPVAVMPPLVPNGRLVLLNGTAARRTEGSDAFRCSETCGGPPASRFGAASFSTVASGSNESKSGP